MLSTLKFDFVLMCLELACWSNGMQEAFHLIPIEGDRQQLPKAVISARNENLPLFHKSNFRGQDGYPLISSAEPVTRQQKVRPVSETINYLLDNEIPFPYEQYDDFWSFAEESQPKLSQPGGYQEFSSSPTDVYFNELCDLHTNYLQAESIQHIDQNTNNLINHQPLSNALGIQTPAPQITQPVEAVVRQQLVPGCEKDNYLLDNEIPFPYEQYDDFWSFAEESQPKLSQPGGYQEFSSSPTDFYFNELCDLHTNYLQAESIQHIDQNTNNLINHQPLSNALGIQTPAPQITQPVEAVVRQQLVPGCEKDNYLLDNEIPFPYEQYDDFWSFAEESQPKLSQPGGYQEFSSSPTDFYFNELCDLHTNYLQAESIQHIDQNTNNLINHQPLSNALGIQTPASQITQPVEAVVRQQLVPGCEKDNYLLDNEIPFPYEQYDDFWSFTGESQPKLSPPGGYQDLPSNPTDVYFNELYDLHANYLQDKNTQRTDQNTNNLINHQPLSNPFEYTFGIETPTPQIFQSKIPKIAYDSGQSSFASNLGYLTNQLTHQAPVTHELCGTLQLEHKREETNANLMPTLPPGNSNMKFSQTGDAKNLDKERLKFSEPSYDVSQSSYSKTAEIDSKKSPLLKTTNDDRNLAETSKKRKRQAFKKKIEAHENTVENRKQIIATLTRKFRVDFGEDKKLMSVKPIWRRFPPKVNILDQEKAADIRILEFGAIFDKEAKDQIEEIKKGMKVFTIDDKKNISAQKYKMKSRLFNSITSIRWDKYNSNDLEDAISKLTSKIDIPSEKGVYAPSIKSNFEDLSIITTILMKIIASIFSGHKKSIHFGNEVKIFQYLENFWKTCFAKNPDLKIFCQSIGAILDSAIEKCLSIGINKSKGLQTIFESVKINVLGNGMRAETKLKFAWSLISVRFGIFYPKKTLRLQYSDPSSSLINFIESALLYFIMRS
ncbi:hypothetical protein BY996DRAFT_745845 [Phakopsora pachyrhizi]|nr:hypothetical protein BY996DRAFT_745845 [Phakopsora pachyrhizi]